MDKLPGKDMGAILLAGFSALTILFMLGGGALVLVPGIIYWQKTRDITVSLLPALLSTSAFLLGVGLIAPGGIFALRRLQNKPMEEARFKPLSIWLALALFAGWVISIVMAVLLHRQAILQWFSIPFYLLAIGLPVFMLIRLSTGGLGFGSKLRAWSTLTLGMIGSPLISILGEGLVALAALIAFGIFMGLDPQRLAVIQALAEQLKHIASQEEAFTLLGPILANPLTLVGGLFFLSVVTPVIEETAKSLPVWLAWRELETSAQGFALGALSGAGFGLMEGLFISTTPGETWGLTLAVRAASSAMHIVTSGLIGWGIGISAQQKRLVPALGRYALGISIHGIWNACVVTMVYASGRVLMSGANVDIAATLIIISVLCFLGLLILCAPIVLWAINHQLRKSLPALPMPENAETPPIENMIR